ncbi:hypothetical protein [Solitalea canadensis]|uniref:Lipocalin-like domain-containing protein n=1 Tax=Solitalea canadensis (strain ATCC 29591 / DSM 3403 / JCM 21819 / LMG 8368 / NBRC 15130 / NCIMB 12057 / USAM 9D) TaxID=929556 RepID=H8KL09_SOLCM|nr:hypothetical protein [Solitalea canadensis]AFD08826.1 hypothetical protein Solca_3827 [Solitalea canadensis DSM 3403]
MKSINYLAFIALLWCSCSKENNEPIPATKLTLNELTSRKWALILDIYYPDGVREFKTASLQFSSNKNYLLVKTDLDINGNVVKDWGNFSLDETAGIIKWLDKDTIYSYQMNPIDTTKFDITGVNYVDKVDWILKSREGNRLLFTKKEFTIVLKPE